MSWGWFYTIYFCLIDSFQNRKMKETREGIKNSHEDGKMEHLTLKSPIYLVIVSENTNICEENWRNRETQTFI